MTKIGYMTNAFGPIYGSAAGVTDIKSNGYYSDIDLKKTLKIIKDKGYEYVEIFEINLLEFENNVSELLDLCKETGISILSVYVGCQFIYEDALADELSKVERISALAKQVGAKYIVFGGGALRANPKSGDMKLLANGVDKAAEICRKNDLIPAFHPHLGSLVQSYEQINEFFSYSKIGFCPDIAHLVAGGSDALELVKKYMDRIDFVHLKDMDENGNFCPLGTGKINLEAIITYLNENGYKGDWMVEIDGYSGSSEYACEISKKYLEGKI